MAAGIEMANLFSKSCMCNKLCDFFHNKQKF